jgi:hypothetical protein
LLTTENSCFENYAAQAEIVVATKKPFGIFRAPLARIPGCAVTARAGQWNLEKPNADD